ncbi:MAG: MobF family relaxase [Myxococcota bacterium]
MLRFHAGTDAEGAKAYFDKGLQREDYYTEGREVAGMWRGLGATLLGLRGKVDRDQFHALCENTHPETGERLTARTKANRRVGFDISFSVPKSVSIHQALTDSAEILEAFKASVRETMEEMERDAAARVRKDGANHNRTTGNLAWAEFIHFTARPVEGRSDPHLHAHCYTFNSTFDAIEECWKAVDLEEVWKRAPYYQAAFDSRFAERLQDLGFQIERHANGWELEGYSRELVETFSRRTALINAFAEARGIQSDRLKDQFGALTREAKKEGEDKAQQRAEWASRLTSEELQGTLLRERVRKERMARGVSVSLDRTAADCLDFATAHGFERQSVVREVSLLADAIGHGLGSVSVAEVEAEFARRKADGRLISAQIHGTAQVTTPEVLREERAMVKWAQDGRGTRKALAADGAARNTAFRELMSDGRLPDSHQIAAVEHVLSSQDRVILVRGKAGTGKTTMMRAARDGIRAGGREVFFFAPGAEASRGVLVGEGFENATTVAKLLQDDALQSDIEGQVIWVDEAGTLGAPDMSRLFEIADRTNARVVLSGDVTQHAPVARGDALRVLENEAGLRPAELTRIYRQTNRVYREAVEAISSGERSGIEAGFAQLDEMGAIREVASEERYVELAQGYLSTVLEDQKTALVVSPTHSEGEKVTSTIREGLREARMLEAEERTFSRLRSLGLTEAERGDAANYRPGVVVQAHRAVAGLKRGQKYRVVSNEGTKVWVENAEARGPDQPIALPLRQADRFDVFTEDAIGLSRGDRIRITRNGMAASCGPSGRRQELRNGAIYEVDSFTEGGDLRVLGRNAKGRVTGTFVVGRDYGNLTHGYCVTSHASQGKTVDRVLIAQGSESFPASSSEQFYVSVSRGRESVVIYTDDREQLRARVMASATRTSALELERFGMREDSKRLQRHVLWTQRVRGEARAFARAQTVGLLRQARAAAQQMWRRRDGPERTI